MTAGMWGAILFLAAAAAGVALIWQGTQPEDPPDGIIIALIHELDDNDRRVRSRWHYIAEDRRAMTSTGYITRRSAIRAAQAELNRLNAKDETTQ